MMRALGLPGKLRGILVREALLVVALAIAVGIGLWLGASINRNANQTAVARVDGIASLLLAKLENEGIGATRTFAEDLMALVPEDGDQRTLRIGLWRMMGTTPQWVINPGETVAAAMTGAKAGTATRQATAADGPIYLNVPDIAAASRDWATPMSRVGLAVALARPTPEERNARIISWLLLAGLAGTVGLIVYAAFERRRRYTAALLQINRDLHRFSDGETDVRVYRGESIPELKELAEQLNSVLARLEELISGLRLLSGYVAHELKTPLQTIRSDVARFERAAETEERMAIASEINRAIDNADGRLAAMTELSRLETDNRLQMDDALDFSGLVEGAVDDMIAPLEARGLTIVDRLAPGITVTGHARLLELMVQNLLSNCQKYAPDGAEVTVTLQAVPTPEAEGPGFLLSIGNDGAGFPKDVRQTAFKSFVRSSQADGAPGVGLGLSLVYAIARRHSFLAAIAPDTDRAIITVSGPCATPGDAAAPSPQALEAVQ